METCGTHLVVGSLRWAATTSGMHKPLAHVVHFSNHAERSQSYSWSPHKPVIVSRRKDQGPVFNSSYLLSAQQNTICTNSKFPPSPLPKKNRKNNTHKITLLRLAQDCPCFRCRAAFKLPTLPPLRLPMPHASRDVSPQASPRRKPRQKIGSMFCLLGSLLGVRCFFDHVVGCFCTVSWLELVFGVDLGLISRCRWAGGFGVACS